MNKFLKTLLIFGIWGLAFFAIKIENRIYNADKYFVISTDLTKEKKYDEALMFADKSISFNSLEPSYYRQRALVFLSMQAVDSSKDRKLLKDRAFKDMKRAFDLNRKNLVTVRDLLPLYYFLAVNDASLPSGVENLDKDYINQLLDFFSAVKKTYARDTGVVSSVALYERLLGLKEQYEESREVVKKLRPDLLDWYSSFN